MQDIRNIAIIAHVDHGKTTLVDKMLMAGHIFRANQETGTQILDSNDLERERGITILSKNVSIRYKGVKINIIDTPGHSDFGGEVERVLNMADGCLLLIDAFEGPMPQTRFVLEKALKIGLKPIVVVNKVDKPNCRPEEVYEMAFDLMCALNATEDQLDFPVVYGSAKQGWMGPDYKKPTNDITYLLDTIIKTIPAPKVLEGTPQVLITTLDYSNYTGRIAVGRVHRGTIRAESPDGRTIRPEFGSRLVLGALDDGAAACHAVSRHGAALLGGVLGVLGILRGRRALRRGSGLRCRSGLGRARRSKTAGAGIGAVRGMSGSVRRRRILLR